MCRYITNFTISTQLKCYMSALRTLTLYARSQVLIMGSKASPTRLYKTSSTIYSA
jgi:hypothetical protein